MRRFMAAATRLAKHLRESRALLRRQPSPVVRRGTCSKVAEQTLSAPRLRNRFIGLALARWSAQRRARAGPDTRKPTTGMVEGPTGDPEFSRSLAAPSATPACNSGLRRT